MNKLALFAIGLIFVSITLAQTDISSPPDFTITVKHEYRGDKKISLMHLQRMFLANPVVKSEPMGLGSLYAFDEKDGLVVMAGVSFYSSSKKCLFDDRPAVDFVVDGETISVPGNAEGVTRGDGFTFTFPQIEEGVCNDAIDVMLPRAKYLKIANAKKQIKVRAGKLSFELNQLHIAALNEMARRMPK